MPRSSIAMRAVVTLLPLSLLSLVALAGCKAGAPMPAPTPSASGGDYVAKVKALDPGQRIGVLFRAIRDAGQSCQQVVDEKPLPTTTGAAWLATCDDQSHWVVGISDNGTATVANARDLTKSR